MNSARYENWQWLLFHSVKRLQLFTVPCFDTPVILMIFYYSDETAVAVVLVIYKKTLLQVIFIVFTTKTTKLFRRSTLHSIEKFFDLKYPQWVLWILKNYIYVNIFTFQKHFMQWNCTWVWYTNIYLDIYARVLRLPQMTVNKENFDKLNKFYSPSIWLAFGHDQEQSC